MYSLRRRQGKEMIRLRDLAAGATFKRPEDTDIYQVTGIVDKNCSRRSIICNNLTSGINYAWEDLQEVIRVSSPVGKQKFFMCFVEGEGIPTYRHFSQEEADTEAERLARLTGKTVFVLSAFKYVEISIPVPPPTWDYTSLRT